jgi:crossover junction endodeoxyribonuclease RuvC
VIYFGIDPGSAITGYGIIRVSNNTLSYVDAGVIVTDKRALLPRKLEVIYDALHEKLSEFKPDCASIEEAFYAKNVHTTLVLGHARGVAILAAQKLSIPVLEFTPRVIKKAVVGNGNATKEQVEFMVKTILRLPRKEIHSDMYDALAAALCAYNHSKSLFEKRPGDKQKPVS